MRRARPARARASPYPEVDRALERRRIDRWTEHAELAAGILPADSTVELEQRLGRRVTDRADLEPGVEDLGRERRAPARVVGDHGHVDLGGTSRGEQRERV